MKKVLFVGFFGMAEKHAKHYINMWNNMNCKVDYYPYSTLDVLNYQKWLSLRETFEPKEKKYDVAHCISGGSLYLHTLQRAKNPVVFDKLILDSGPYLPSSKHIENYVQQSFGITGIPLDKAIRAFYKMQNCNFEKDEKEFREHTLHDKIPKLVIFSEQDKLIIQDFIKKFVEENKNNKLFKHHAFRTGKHADLYRQHPEKYKELINEFIKK